MQNSSFSEHRQQKQRRRQSESSSITFVNRPSVEAQPPELQSQALASCPAENSGLVAVLTQQLQLLAKIVEQKDAEIERYRCTVDELEAENAALRRAAQKNVENAKKTEKPVEKEPVTTSDDEDTFYKAQLISSGPVNERIQPFDSKMLQSQNSVQNVSELQE